MSLQWSPGEDTWTTPPVCQAHLGRHLSSRRAGPSELPHAVPAQLCFVHMSWNPVTDAWLSCEDRLKATSKKAGSMNETLVACVQPKAHKINRREADYEACTGCSVAVDINREEPNKQNWVSVTFMGRCVCLGLQRLRLVVHVEAVKWWIRYLWAANDSNNALACEDVAYAYICTLCCHSSCTPGCVAAHHYM